MAHQISVCTSNTKSRENQAELYYSNQREHYRADYYKHSHLLLQNNDSAQCASFHNLLIIIRKTVRIIVQRITQRVKKYKFKL